VDLAYILFWIDKMPQQQHDSLTEPEAQKVSELVALIRAKKPSASMFLAMFETFPKHIWAQSVREGIMTAPEYQACMLVLKQYRRAQAVSAIQEL
jgi:hypothetical protein